MAANLKETLHTLAEELPDNATWDDVLEEVRFRRAVETGIKAADRGEFASANEVRETFASWGVNVES
jgi:predicted transcriptional regulator